MSAQSAITDEMRAAIGRESAPRTAWDEVSRGEIRRYAQAVMDPNPVYWDEEHARGTKFGGVVAPPFLPGKIYRVRPDAPDPLREDLGAWDGAHTPRGESDLKIPWPAGWIVLHGSDEAEIYQLARPGDTITSRSKLVDMYERPGPQRAAGHGRDRDLLLQPARRAAVREPRRVGRAGRPAAASRRERGGDALSSTTSRSARRYRRSSSR